MAGEALGVAVDGEVQMRMKIFWPYIMSALVCRQDLCSPSEKIFSFPLRPYGSPFCRSGILREFRAATRGAASVRRRKSFRILNLRALAKKLANYLQPRFLCGPATLMPISCPPPLTRQRGKYH